MGDVSGDGAVKGLTSRVGFLSLCFSKWPVFHVSYYCPCAQVEEIKYITWPYVQQSSDFVFWRMLNREMGLETRELLNSNPAVHWLVMWPWAAHWTSDCFFLRNLLGVVSIRTMLISEKSACAKRCSSYFLVSFLRGKRSVLTLGDAELFNDNHCNE